MNPIRERTKDQFPSVLLTLLSIVQALALGMLWTHIEESPFLFEPSFSAAFYWSQAVVTFLSMLLIWLLYVNTVMRFRWVPGIVESVLPFFIGLLEFVMVATMGPDLIGLWFVLFAAICAIASYSAHQTFVRARLEEENQTFFQNVAPATYRDYLPSIILVVTFAFAGLLLLQSDHPNVLAVIMMAGAYAFVISQFITSAKWWQSSLGEG